MAVAQETQFCHNAKTKLFTFNTNQRNNGFFFDENDNKVCAATQFKHVVDK